jgi:hypothetical protein
MDMFDDLWLSAIWILVAGGAGFLIAATLSGVFHLSRRLYLIPYVLLSSLLFGGFLVWSGEDFLEMVSENMAWGLLATLLVGALLVASVAKQPASPRAGGRLLALDLVWAGLVYGAVDAILLGVLPVMAAMSAFSELGGWSGTGGEVVRGLAAIGASAFVTAAYHAGYPEFRNRSIALPVFALVVSSAAFVLTANPLPVLVPHVAMHIAAVIRGPEGTIQLPPHYRPTLQSPQSP